MGAAPSGPSSTAEAWGGGGPTFCCFPTYAEYGAPDPSPPATAGERTKLLPNDRLRSSPASSASPRAAAHHQQHQHPHQHSHHQQHPHPQHPPRDSPRERGRNEGDRDRDTPTPSGRGRGRGRGQPNGTPPPGRGPNRDRGPGHAQGGARQGFPSDDRIPGLHPLNEGFSPRDRRRSRGPEELRMHAGPEDGASDRMRHEEGTEAANITRERAGSGKGQGKSATDSQQIELVDFNLPVDSLLPLSVEKTEPSTFYELEQRERRKSLSVASSGTSQGSPAEVMRSRRQSRSEVGLLEAMAQPAVDIRNVIEHAERQFTPKEKEAKPERLGSANKQAPVDSSANGGFKFGFPAGFVPNKAEVEVDESSSIDRKPTEGRPPIQFPFPQRERTPKPKQEAETKRRQEEKALLRAQLEAEIRQERQRRREELAFKASQRASEAAAAQRTEEEKRAMEIGAIVLQARARRFLSRRQYLETRGACLLLQSLVRSYFARRELGALKREKRAEEERERQRQREELRKVEEQRRAEKEIKRVEKMKRLEEEQNRREREELERERLEEEERRQERKRLEELAVRLGEAEKRQREEQLRHEEERQLEEKQKRAEEWRKAEEQRINAKQERRRKKHLAAVTLQRFIRGYLDRKAIRGFQELCIKRRFIVQEILLTEKSYYDVLVTLNELFEAPLLEIAANEDSWIKLEDVHLIFSDVGRIAEVHKKLLQRFEQAYQDWHTHTSKIGDIFLEMMDALKFYTGYINNYDRANVVLKEYFLNPAFKQFVEKVESDNSKRDRLLDLPSLLISPVQRIPRYELLLRDLLKNTWPEHCDYDNIEEALEKVKLLANYINENKRTADNKERMKGITSQLKGLRGKKMKKTLVRPGRELMREGRLLRVTKKKVKEDYVFLFNDLVVVSQAKNTRKKNNTIRTNYYHNEELKLEGGTAVAANDERTFILRLPHEKFTWKAASKKERDDWLRQLQSIIAAVNAKH